MKKIFTIIVVLLSTVIWCEENKDEVKIITSMEELHGQWLNSVNEVYPSGVGQFARYYYEGGYTSLEALEEGEPFEDGPNWFIDEDGGLHRRRKSWKPWEVAQEWGFKENGDLWMNVVYEGVENYVEYTRIDGELED